MKSLFCVLLRKHREMISKEGKYAPVTNKDIIPDKEAPPTPVDEPVDAEQEDFRLELQKLTGLNEEDCQKFVDAFVNLQMVMSNICERSSNLNKETLIKMAQELANSKGEAQMKRF